MASPSLTSTRVGFAALRANPLRTFLSTLGVIMGVAALVSVLSLGDGMEHFARTQIDRTSDLQFIQVNPVTTREVDGQSFPRPDVRLFTVDDVAGLQSRLAVPAQVTVVVRAGALVSRPPGRPRGVVVFGATPALAAMRGLHARAGRFFDEAETRAGAPVVVLSNALAAALAAPAAGVSLVDSTVLVQGQPRRVVGVLAPGQDSTALQAFVPITGAVAAMLPSTTVRAPMLLIHVDSVNQVDSARAVVERWLAAGDPAWKDRVRVVTNEYRLGQVQQGLLLFKLLMGALTGISLLVGGIGIMNVLLASVAERTREIGIRRAAGARRREIMTQFLAESVAITSTGAVVGAVFGVAAAYTVTAVMRARTRATVYAGLSWSTLAVAALAALVVGIGFGLYPALKAARLSPIDAIRHE
ncbi:MAG: ABC transporter permease [Gemmatimonadaceae bacterium]|nr:ABC transporter permease [Gemmatimonadaceae bacterium]